MESISRSRLLVRRDALHTQPGGLSLPISTVPHL